MTISVGDRLYRSRVDPEGPVVRVLSYRDGVVHYAGDAVNQSTSEVRFLAEFEEAEG